MKASKIFYLLQKENISCAAIIGLAKNTGKTTTLNTLVKEAAGSGALIALASYGRDGEETDAITLKEKPKIFIPPGSYFVTTDRLFKKSGISAAVSEETDITGVLGRIYIYRCGSEGGTVELAGVNRGSRMAEIKEKIGKRSDFFFIDGALDRVSSAVPALSDGIILATGAVLGRSVSRVVEKTVTEIRKVVIPECRDINKKSIEKILNAKKNGLLRGNEIFLYESAAPFAGDSLFKSAGILDGDTIVLTGALTDSVFERFLYSSARKKFSVIVRDGTKIFLSQRNLNVIRRKGISLYVFSPIKLLAVTINPVSPYGYGFDSKELSSKLSETLGRLGVDIPVIDVLSDSPILPQHLP